jgi:hypothetical protein
LIDEKVVCVTNISSRSELLRIDKICHENNIQLVAGDVYGLFGFVFDDFGMGTDVDKNGNKLGFKVMDVDGEPPKTCYIESITKVSENGSLSFSFSFSFSFFYFFTFPVHLYFELFCFVLFGVHIVDEMCFCFFLCVCVVYD